MDLFNGRPEKIQPHSPPLQVGDQTRCIFYLFVMVPMRSPTLANISFATSARPEDHIVLQLGDLTPHSDLSRQSSYHDLNKMENKAEVTVEKGEAWEGFQDEPLPDKVNFIVVSRNDALTFCVRKDSRKIYEKFAVPRYFFCSLLQPCLI